MMASKESSLITGSELAAALIAITIKYREKVRSVQVSLVRFDAGSELYR